MATGRGNDHPRAVGLVVWPHVNGDLIVLVNQADTITTHAISHKFGVVSQEDWLIRQILNLLPDQPAYIGIEGLYELQLRAKCDDIIGHLLVTQEIKQVGDELAHRTMAALPNEILRYPRPHWYPVPPDIDQYTVGTDASVTPRRGAWAYITGSGWYASGIVRTNSVPLAEWIAACEALSIFHDGARVTLLVDNSDVIETMQAIIQGLRSHKPSWLTERAYRRGVKNLSRLTVLPEWIPRASHVLNGLADQLCGHVSRGLASPTVSLAKAL